MGRVRDTISDKIEKHIEKHHDRHRPEYAHAKDCDCERCRHDAYKDVEHHDLDA